ncbi:MAG: sigma-70 family RNA polymerase sigma factor [Acidobacteriota bacterium]
MRAPSQDVELARRTADGDREAFAQVFDEHAPIVLGVLHRILRRRDVAEEVLQDAFLQAWRKIDNFDPQRGTLRSWLVTMARSRALDHLKSSKARGAREERVGKYETPTVEEAVGTKELELSENRLRVRRALDSLPAEQREAIELAYFGGLTHSQLAARLEAPLGTVKSRVKLGMTKLKAALAS